MHKGLLRAGALVSALSVILGAFGAHALKGTLLPEQLATFETGVRYHFYHAFAILLVDLLVHFRKNNLLLAAGWLFIAGIICFSGSLYALSLRGMMSPSVSVSWLGPVTPLGGAFFVFGWGTLFLSSFFAAAKGSNREK